jgi:O-antigen/teichoic acid export membrane protein
MLAAGLLLGPRFLSQGLDGWWAAAMAARAAAVHPTSALGASLRLVGAFRASGWLRLATQLLVTAVTILALTASPSLAGYFAGTAVATALALVLGLVVAARQVRRALDAPLVRLAPRVVFEQYLAAGRFLAGGSLAGLAKLFSRSADTLVVAALTNDTVTGLYRVARQAYDNLAGLSDAVHQFYTPTIVDCIAGGRWDEYARHRRRLMLIGAAAAAGAVLLSSAVLRPLALARYPQYLPALPAFEVLAGLLLVTLGIHGWMWPSLVAADRVGLFGVLGLAGAIAQLGTIAALAALGVLDATTAAAAAWVMAALNYGPVVAALWHQRLKRQA